MANSNLSYRSLQPMGGLFTRALLRWNRKANTRSMPWKGEPDPYKIWISEIILQQTRVEQGWPYYERFIKEFPSIKALAKAPEQKVFKFWEGLGYYTRCRNLIATANIIENQYKGRFPNDYQQILDLKGVGPYTAAAIASFAFNLPHAVVDGNVYRVISRVFSIAKPIDSSEGKAHFNMVAGELLDRKNPATYNQAIMDFGATVCKPQAPLCSTCTMKKFCMAYALGKTEFLHLKSNKTSIKKRWFYYFMLRFGNRVYIRQRLGKDIWQKLYEFYLHESPKKLDAKQIHDKLSAILPESCSFQVTEISTVHRQKLTHQHISGQFIEVVIDKPLADTGEFELVSLNKLKRFAFPKFIISYLREKNVNLSQD
jgi:A/G-specific adenine glycosylase